MALIASVDEPLAGGTLRVLLAGIRAVSSPLKCDLPSLIEDHLDGVTLRFHGASPAFSKRFDAFKSTSRERGQSASVGPFATASAALAALETSHVDGAILDANLLDGNITPVARLLLARRIPVVVHTGVGLPAELADFRKRLPVVMKPAHASRATAALAEQLAKPV
jgi:hypothetical protein